MDSHAVDAVYVLADPSLHLSVTLQGGSPLNKAKKLISPNRMRSFTELFRQDRPISAPSSQTKAGGEGVKAVSELVWVYAVKECLGGHLPHIAMTQNLPWPYVNLVGY